MPRPCLPLLLSLLLLSSAPVPAFLDDPAGPVPDAVVADPSATAPAELFAPRDTEIVLEMLDTVSSKTHARGDTFRMRVAAPLVVDGQVLVPAGAPVHGEVVHAAGTRFGGEAGELILAARHVELDGRRIPLRAFQTGLGRNRERLAATVLVVASPAVLLVRGKHVEIAAGGLSTARLREDLRGPSRGPAPVSDSAPADAIPAAVPTEDSTGE